MGNSWILPGQTNLGLLLGTKPCLVLFLLLQTFPGHPLAHDVHFSGGPTVQVGVAQIHLGSSGWSKGSLAHWEVFLSPPHKGRAHLCSCSHFKVLWSDFYGIKEYSDHLILWFWKWMSLVLLLEKIRCRHFIKITLKSDLKEEQYWTMKDVLLIFIIGEIFI